MTSKTATSSPAYRRLVPDVYRTIDGRLLTPAEFVAETPVARPTFVAPPRRLARLMAQARRLPPADSVP